MAKMLLTSETDLVRLGRQHDGPMQVRAKGGKHGLERGKEFDVIVVARGKCRCEIEVMILCIRIFEK